MARSPFMLRRVVIVEIFAHYVPHFQRSWSDFFLLLTLFTLICGLDWRISRPCWGCFVFFLSFFSTAKILFRAGFLFAFHKETSGFSLILAEIIWCFRAESEKYFGARESRSGSWICRPTHLFAGHFYAHGSGNS